MGSKFDGVEPGMEFFGEGAGFGRLELECGLNAGH